VRAGRTSRETGLGRSVLLRDPAGGFLEQTAFCSRGQVRRLLSTARCRVQFDCPSLGAFFGDGVDKGGRVMLSHNLSLVEARDRE
jgi:hypothetical protein